MIFSLLLFYEFIGLLHGNNIYNHIYSIRIDECIPNENNASTGKENVYYQK